MFQGPSQTSLVSSYLHHSDDNNGHHAFPASYESQLDFFPKQNVHQNQRASFISFIPSIPSDSISRVKQRNARSRSCSSAVCWPLILILICLLLPNATLLVLVLYYRIEPGKDLFAIPGDAAQDGGLHVDMSATILTTISSISSTLAPFLIGMIMVIWNLYVAVSLLKASREDSNASNPLPRPDEFSLLANMRAGRCDQIWKYLSIRRHASYTRSPIVRLTVLVMFMSVFVTFLAFLGDQFFHIWSESVLLQRYETSDDFSSFGRGLTPLCLNFSRADNYGWPCSRSSYAFISKQEYDMREQEVSSLRTNTSKLSQIQFLTAANLPKGDLALLRHAPSIVPPHYDYHASTLGVSTQCEFMTPQCGVKHISNILTQFNCSDTFFGVLGKPANISSNMQYKAQDPDVPGLAWKISPSLQYAFYSDANREAPYNVRGWNPITGYEDENLPLLPDSELVNPVYLSVAGRVTLNDIAANGSLAAESSNKIFVPTFDNTVFDFFLNCSYTTYDVAYTIANQTTLPGFTFAPSPNGSVAEMWHGRQQYTSLSGDPSDGLAENNWMAGRQQTLEEFARSWANLYSVRVLSVVGAYTDPRLNMQQQVRDQKIVTLIAPWALGFLLAANFSYVLLAFVVSAIAWAVSTHEVLQVSENMDLNRQITERYIGEEMQGVENDLAYTSNVEVMGKPDPDSTLRVGIVRNRFETLYYAA